MGLIDLKGDTNFTLQNQSAAPPVGRERSKAWALSVVPHFSLSLCRVSPFSRGLIFTWALVSLALLLSLRKNGDYS